MGTGHFFNAVAAFISEFVSEKDLLALPFGQVMLFVVINSFCLLFGRHKLGLLITYCFVFYWGFISNREYFIDRLGNTTWGLVVYALSGIVMIVIFIIGFFQESRE